MTEPAPSPKGQQTRAAIADAAQELFLERGYDGTTMRAVADRAGVSLGNAYYYFASKDHLVQAFYDRIQVDHAAAVDAALETERTFEARLRAVMSAWVDVAEPYHDFAGRFFRVAAEPTSPLSPFSEESTPAREASVAMFARVVDGSTLRVPATLRGELPRLLWLAHMGVVLYWVHDRSEGQRRTRELVDGVVPLLARLLRLTRVPGVGRAAEDVVRLVRRLSA